MKQTNSHVFFQNAFLLPRGIFFKRETFLRLLEPNLLIANRLHTVLKEILRFESSFNMAGSHKGSATAAYFINLCACSVVSPTFFRFKAFLIIIGEQCLLNVFSSCFNFVVFFLNCNPMYNT